MATKKTSNTPAKKAPAAKAKAAAPVKAPRAVKAPQAPTGPRHPDGRVKAAHGSKADLAKSLAGLVSGTGADPAAVESRRAKASNAQLLRLQRVSERVKQKFGSRDKLIAAIGTAEKKSTDKDFIARLEQYSLPQLFDLATASEKRAR